MEMDVNWEEAEVMINDRVLPEPEGALVLTALEDIQLMATDADSDILDLEDTSRLVAQ